jgi:hypothetical protein
MPTTAAREGERGERKGRGRRGHKPLLSIPCLVLPSSSPPFHHLTDGPPPSVHACAPQRCPRGSRREGKRRNAAVDGCGTVRWGAEAHRSDQVSISSRCSAAPRSAPLLREPLTAIRAARAAERRHPSDQGVGGSYARRGWGELDATTGGFGLSKGGQVRPVRCLGREDAPPWSWRWNLT